MAFMAGTIERAASMMRTMIGIVGYFAWQSHVEYHPTPRDRVIMDRECDDGVPGRLGCRAAPTRPFRGEAASDQRLYPVSGRPWDDCAATSVRARPRPNPCRRGRTPAPVPARSRPG